MRCAERGGVPMYCNAKRQTCFASDGQCGQLGAESYTCPDRSPYLPPNVKVVCDRPNNQLSGTCVFEFESNVSDKLLEDVERDIEILSPHSGASLASASDLRIDVTGSAAPVFVLLLGPSTALQRSKSKDADRVKSLDDLFEKAAWAAAVPRAAAKSRRHIAWSDGHAVKDGRWKLESGQPPPGIYALFALAMEGDEVVAISSDFPQLQIGSDAASGFAAEGQTCSSPAECYSPTSVLACIDVKCRRLCLSDTDCEQNPAGEDAAPGYCYQNLDADFRYCRFDSQ